LTSSRSDGSSVGGVLTNLCSAALVLFVFFHASACHRTPSPALLPDFDSKSAVLQLQHDIDSRLAASAVERGTWAVLARSLTTGDTLYSANARKLLMPASLMKLLTLAVAADRLGWDYSYETSLLANGSIAGGSLHGDLVVVGGGDPSIDDWDGFATGLFHDWAERLKGLGIRVITGRIVGDDNTFDEDAFGAGWAWDDLSASFATGFGALQFNQNTARLRITPGERIGDRAGVTILPDNSGIVPLDYLTTEAADRPASIVTRRLPGSPTLDIRGTVPLGSEPLFRNVSVDNPTLYFVTALREALIANGIEVQGPAVDVDSLVPLPGREQASPLVAHRSPPLSVLATTMMKNSQNLYAETFFRTLTASLGSDSTDGRPMVASVLGSWNIPDSDLVVADGSGLSRYNLATAEAIVTLLTRIHQDDRLRESFQATLPIAGRDGTLARRFTGTAADGTTRAKTGSLSNARTLAGYVETADGEPLAFCILANNYGPAETEVEQAIDAIVIRLAEFSRRARSR
jgi:D-alanyl-D-alanine carboxypeptidase/D-alanyl-D-alanine-endopeptidase (penicillin-binding protein 4)